MPIYRFEIDAPNGDSIVRRVTAQNEWDAAEIIGVPSSRVLSRSRDYLAELDAMLPKPAPKLGDQARVLAVFAAQVNSGANPSKVLDRLIETVPSMAQHKEAVRACPKVSDKLKIMRFDPQLLLLADVGEKSGLIGEVMGGAADEIIEREQMMSEVKKEMVPAVIVAALGIAILFILPVFMVDPLLSLRNARGIVMPENICTHFLIYVGLMMKPMISWFILVGVMVGIYITRRAWWPLLRNIPGFSSVENFFKVQHGFYFISAFTPMFSRGVSINQTVDMMESFATGRAKSVFNEIREHMKRGGSISNAFGSDYWDPILRDCMSGFDTMKQENKIDLLRRVRPLMGQVMQKSGQRLAGIVSTLGLTLAVTVTMVVFIGLTLPLMNVSTPMNY